jgi:hypothetical protein
MYVTEPPFGNGTLYDDMVTDKAAHRVSDKFVAAVVRRPGQESATLAACGASMPARRGAQRPTIESRRRYPGIFIGRGPCTCDFIDHSKARADRTVHATGARPFVRVFTRQSRLPFIADRGTGDAASERIVRPAHHRTSESGHSAAGDFGQRRVDVTEHIVLSETATFRLDAEDGRDDRRTRRWHARSP